MFCIDVFPSLTKVPRTTHNSHFWLLSCSWEAQRGQEIFSWSFYWILRVSNYEVLRCLLKYYKYFSSVFLTSYFLHFTKNRCSNRAGRLPFNLCIAAFKYKQASSMVQCCLPARRHRANGSLQFPSLSQSSRTCRTGRPSLVERGCRDPGFSFFPWGFKFLSDKQGENRHSVALLLISFLSLLAQIIRCNLQRDNRFYTATSAFTQTLGNRHTSSPVLQQQHTNQVLYDNRSLPR